MILIIIIWWPTPLCRVAQWNKPLDFFVLVIVLVCHYDYYDCFGLQLWFGDALTQNGEPTWRVANRGGRRKTWIPQTDQKLSPEFQHWCNSQIVTKYCNPSFTFLLNSHKILSPKLHVFAKLWPNTVNCSNFESNSKSTSPLWDSRQEMQYCPGPIATQQPMYQSLKW